MLRGDRQITAGKIICGVPQGSIPGPLWFTVELHASSTFSDR